MMTRILTGVSAAALLVWLVYQGSYSLITSVVLIVAALAYLEFDKLFFPIKSLPRQLRLIAIIAITIIAMRTDFALGWLSFWFCFVGLCSTHMLRAGQGEEYSKAVTQLSMELMGYVYTVCLFGFLVPIAEHGRQYLLLLFFIVFMGDTAAYFVGIRFGKRRLAPRISPKKTVEGAVAAIVGSLLISLVWLQWVHTGPSTAYFWKSVLLFAPLGSVLAQVGDLFESLLKRSQSQKDSGAFLPGHGGVLDRIDGIALIAPVFYVFVTSVLERG